MNKWIKKSMVGLTLSMAALNAQASADETKIDSQNSNTISEAVLDASDLIASKLKDRMMIFDESSLQEGLQIDASDLIASKLKDRMMDFDV